MKKYKGIIFDLDGTLLDTIEDLGDSINKVLEEFDFHIFSYDEYKLKVGGGIKSLVIKSFPEGSDEETIGKGLKLFVDYYDKNYLNKTKPYIGILEMLNTLKDKKIKLAVNSNKGNEYTNNLVKKYFSETPFLKIYGEREGVMVKPDPTSALQIAESMNLKPGDILYIGDSNTDILTGKNAGMDTVGVIWGFRGKKELEEYGASFTVENPNDILDIVL